MRWEDAWDRVDEAWRRALGLAWEAFAEGSIAVGAVVLGPDGRVVAEGRNRAGEPDPPPGQLGGARVAHAEVNALGRIPRPLGDTTLLTTLEPCIMCTTVARFAHVAVIRYAAPDPVWEGADRIGELNALYARHPMDRRPADLGPLSTWSGGLALLSVARWITSQTEGSVAEVLATGHLASTIRVVQPEAVRLAEALRAGGLEPAPAVTLEQALDRWWPVVEAAGTPR